MKKVLHQLIFLVHDIFPLGIVMYLVFILAETLLPGFVNSNINLNLVLLGVIILGLVDVLLPREERMFSQKDMGRNSKIRRLILAFMGGMMAGCIVFWQYKEVKIPSPLIASIIGVISGVLGWVVVGLNWETEALPENPVDIRESISSIRTYLIGVVTKKVTFPLFILLIFLTIPILGSFLGVQKTKNTEASKNGVPTLLKETYAPVSPYSKILIKIQYGRADIVNSTLLSDLTDVGFEQIYFEKVANQIKTNATVQFQPADQEAAQIIKQILENEYPLVELSPQQVTDASITITLGEKEF